MPAFQSQTELLSRKLFQQLSIVSQNKAFESSDLCMNERLGKLVKYQVHAVQAYQARKILQTESMSIILCGTLFRMRVN